MDVAQFSFTPVVYQTLDGTSEREIVFKDMATGEVAYTTVLDGSGVADYRSTLGYFAETIRKDLRLVSGYDVLYGKVKDFVQDRLFGETVLLNDPNTLYSLSELPAKKTVIETFKRAINDLTVQDRGDAQLSETIRVQDTRPFMVKEQESLIPQKSVFNRITGTVILNWNLPHFSKTALMLSLTPKTTLGCTSNSIISTPMATSLTTTQIFSSS